MIVANGIRTRYERMRPKHQGAGANPPKVVLIHGLGIDNLACLYMTMAAPLAAAGIDVIAYDLRGHGRSEMPPAGYRLSDFVADLAALLDGLGIDEPVHLVGNSFGGTLAFSFAAAHPGRTASLVAIDTEPATVAWGNKIGEVLTVIMRGTANEEYFAEVEEEHGKHVARLARASVSRMRATTITSEIPLGPLLGPAELRAIQCPVLSILGSEGSQKHDLTGLKSVLPQARIEVLPSQDHFLVLWDHRTVRALLLDWVAGCQLSTADVAADIA